MYGICMLLYATFHRFICWSSANFKSNVLLKFSSFFSYVANFLESLFFVQVLGALWYLLSVDRQTACWKMSCRNETGCNIRYLDCDTPNQTWASTTGIFSSCNASDDSITFDYGMFQPALSNQAPAQGFLRKFFYSLWWGLQNLRYFCRGHLDIVGY